MQVPSSFDTPGLDSSEIVALWGPGARADAASMTLAATCPRCSESELTDRLARTRTSFEADIKSWRSPGVDHVVVDGEDTTDGVHVVSLLGSNDRTYQEWRPLRAARCTARDTLVLMQRSEICWRRTKRQRSSSGMVVGKRPGTGGGMADAVDLGSTAERRRGSSPLPCTSQ